MTETMRETIHQASDLTSVEMQQLAQYETVIATGLTTFVEVGTALLAIRDARLYRTTHRTFETYCRERWGMAKSTAYQHIEAAEVVENVRNCGQILPATESQARPLTRLAPDDQRTVWQEAVTTAPNGNVTAVHVQAVMARHDTDTKGSHNGQTDLLPSPSPALQANSKTLGYVGRQPGTPERDSDAWYTPPEYIALAHSTMGGIDLDPFSSETANQLIRATRIFTADSSAFEHSWLSSPPSPLRVWMNPPYSVAILPKAIAAFLDYWQSGYIEQALVLVNNCTETLWFKALREACAAVCFPTARIAFVSPDGKPISGGTRGQVVFYYGTPHNAEHFVHTFRAVGWVIDKEHGWVPHA